MLGTGVLGLPRQQRMVYSVYAWGPSMKWLGSSTLMLDGHRMNIFRSRPVEAPY